MRLLVIDERELEVFDEGDVTDLFLSLLIFLPVVVKYPERGSPPSLTDSSLTDSLTDLAERGAALEEPRSPLMHLVRVVQDTPSLRVTV